MSINKIMFAAAACAAMLSAAQPQETAGELAYFTKDAFDSADMSGIADDIESTLSQCPAAFAADPCRGRYGRIRDIVLNRIMKNVPCLIIQIRMIAFTGVHFNC